MSLSAKEVVSLQSSSRMAKRTRWSKIIKNYELYLFILPALAYFVIFHYLPMYGMQIAFKDYVPSLGITGSPWAGFKYFRRFFASYHFLTLLRNTVGISLYHLAVGFPAPILLALMLNELGSRTYKRIVQTVAYAPHFISTVVMVGMIFSFLRPSNGIVNQFIGMIGLDPIPFMRRPEWFKTVYVLTDVWQNTGWGSIIYLAALAGIDPQLHEAAMMDGATKVQRIRHINIPGIAPTAVILLILNIGRLMRVGFEKILLMQNALNMSASDVIATYVYRVGLIGGQVSFGAAVGLFNAVINFTLLAVVNAIARKLGETSLW